MDELLCQIENLIRRDPAGRGLLGCAPDFPDLCLGQLAPAARELAGSARHVGIVTGFYVPDGDVPAAETDGPPGAAMLADVLGSIGVGVTLITDEHCCSAVRAAMDGIDCDVVACGHASDEWLRGFFASENGRRLTHLVAIERVGPCHTPQSVLAQVRAGAAPAERFAASVTAASHGCCHNMRGEPIDSWSADLHRLFENPPNGVRTIGIGDGGNEIGMGSLPWEILADRLAGAHAGRVPCRIATDWAILGGTSNWGAFALAAVIAAARGRTDVIAAWDAARHAAVLKRMVAEGPAVDGITRRREPTVDGLPFVTYLQPWEGIRRVLGVTG